MPPAARLKNEKRPFPLKEPAKNQKRPLDRKSPIQVRILLPPAASHLRTAIGLPELPVAPRKQTQHFQTAGLPAVFDPLLTYEYTPDSSGFSGQPYVRAAGEELPAYFLFGTPRYVDRDRSGCRARPADDARQRCRRPRPAGRMQGLSASSRARTGRYGCSIWRRNDRGAPGSTTSPSMAITLMTRPE